MSSDHERRNLSSGVRQHSKCPGPGELSVSVTSSHEVQREKGGDRKLWADGTVVAVRYVPLWTSTVPTTEMLRCHSSCGSPAPLLHKGRPHASDATLGRGGEPARPHSMPSAYRCTALIEITQSKPTLIDRSTTTRASRSRTSGCRLARRPAASSMIFVTCNTPHSEGTRS
jgi:hypothetical protein